MESESLQPLLHAMKECVEKQIQQAQASQSHNANAALLRALVVKALNDPTIFCGFDQIKHVIQPAVTTTTTTTTSSSSNNSNSVEALLLTLDLFSYGVYQEYHTAPSGTYLVLTDSQLFKLRQLTVLTLAQQQVAFGVTNISSSSSSSRSNNNNNSLLSYETLARHLGFWTDFDDDPANDPANDDLNGSLSQAFRQVEEVIISCLYAGILTGRLCQKTHSLVLGGSTATTTTTTAGGGSGSGVVIQSRDVPLSKVPVLWQQYNQLYQALQQSSKQLERQAARVQKIRNDQDQYWNSVDLRKKSTANTTSSLSSSLLRATSSGGSSSGGGGGGGGGGFQSGFQGALSALASPFAFSSLKEEIMANPSEATPAAAAAVGNTAAARLASGSRRQSKRSRGGLGSGS